MRILLTGATGYIGKRLLNVLAKEGHHVICCVRDKKRFNPPKSFAGQVDVIELDFLDQESLIKIPKDIDAAYYLLHSMSNSTNYQELELLSASNFREVISKTLAKQVIYLSGIVNDPRLSKHLASRLAVEQELAKGSYSFTCLRAGIIIGSGSASFEIIRDLVEKLPFMITPKWLNTKCQPIGIRDVIQFLFSALQNELVFNKSFDIGGPDILSYKEILLKYAEVRGLRRRIFIIPFMTPRLSSYWLYFMTSTSYKLAMALVDSMRIEVICKKSNINKILNIEPLSYKQALKNSFRKIESNQIVSSWKDSLISGRLNIHISDFIDVPTFGCYKDRKSKKFQDRERCMNKIWEIGGNNGWYYANWLWEFRGFIDKLYGGVGLRRGRTNETSLQAGDILDFWRVLYSNKEEGRLLLFAEMKLAGDAWLEFRVQDKKLIQTATFRPKGLSGRFYWHLMIPFHNVIFQGLINKLTK